MTLTSALSWAWLPQAGNLAAILAFVAFQWLPLACAQPYRCGALSPFLGFLSLPDAMGLASSREAASDTSAVLLFCWLFHFLRRSWFDICFAMRVLDEGENAQARRPGTVAADVLYHGLIGAASGVAARPGMLRVFGASPLALQVPAVTAFLAAETLAALRVCSFSNTLQGKPTPAWMSVLAARARPRTLEASSWAAYALVSGISPIGTIMFLVSL